MSGAILVIAVVCFQGQVSDEATFRGEPTSSWIKKLGTKDSAEASNALAQIGQRAVPQLTVALNDTQSSIALKIWAAKTIGDIGPPAADALPSLETAARNSNLVLRLYSARAIWTVGGKPEAAIAVIGEVTKDADPQLLGAAASVVGELGQKGASVLPELLEGLRRQPIINDPSNPAATNIYRAQNEIVEASVKVGEAAVPSLVKVLTVKDFRLVSVAQFALPRIGTPAFSPLVALLGDDKDEVRLAATITLGLLKGKAKEAVVPLKAVLKDKNLGVRVAAVNALWVIAEETVGGESISTVIECLKKGNDGVRLGAVSALSQMGKAARSAKPAIEEVLGDRDVNLSGRAAVALWRIDGTIRLEALRNGLRSGDFATAGEVTTCLGEMREKGHPAIPDILGAIGKTLMGYQASDAIGRMGESAVKPLIDALQSNDRPAVQAAAAEALGKIGPQAADAIDELENARKVPDPSVSVAATEALKKIRGDDSVDVTSQIQRLQSNQPAVRRAAADGLGRRGRSAREAIPALINAMNDDDVEVRKLASDALVAIGAETVPQLIAALSDTRAPVRAGGARALGKIWPRDRAVVAERPLLDLLGDADSEVHSQAGVALVRIGTKDPRAYDSYTVAIKAERDSYLRERAAEGISAYGTRAVDPLIAALTDQDSDVVKAAADSLGDVEPRPKAAVPALLKLLDRSEADIRRPALVSLGKIGIGASEVATVTIALKDKDPDVAWSAALALRNTGAAADKSITDLEAALENPSPRVRRMAAEAIGAIGPNAKSATKSLLKALQDPDLEVRVASLQALPKIKPDAEPVLKVVMETRRSDPSPLAKTWALFTVASIGARNEVVIPILEEALEDQNPDIAAVASESLKKLGPQAVRSVPALLKALGRSESLVRISVVSALQAIGVDASAIDTLIDRLGDDIPEIRVWSANQLAVFKAQARKAVPALRNQLLNTLPRARGAAAWALGQIVPGNNDDATVDSLIITLRDTSGEVRASAASAIGYIAPNSQPAVKELLPLLKDSEVDVRASAAFALGKIGMDPSEVVPALISTMSDPNDQVSGFSRDAVTEFGEVAVKDLRTAALDGNLRVRSEAVKALGGIGSGAISSIPELVAELKDQNPDIQKEAAYALGRVVPGVQRTERLTHFWKLQHALRLLNSVREKVPATEQGRFDAEAVSPVRQAVNNLIGLGLRNYLLLPGAAAVIMIGLLLSSGRFVRYARVRFLNQRWNLGVGECEHQVEVFDHGGVPHVTVANGDAAAANVAAPITIDGDEWPPQEPRFVVLQSNLRAKQNRKSKVRVVVDQSFFPKPWSMLLGSPWSEADDSVIAGQLCRMNIAPPFPAPDLERLTFAGLGCVEPPESSGLKPLNVEAITGEVSAVTSQFRRWGARLLELPASATKDAEIKDFRRALSGAEIVHVSAHASTEGVYLHDSFANLESIEDILGNLRCRLLILSACDAGMLSNDASFVLKLVEKGVNVIAATEIVQQFICRRFFDTFYSALLPKRAAAGIELAQAVRKATAACAEGAGNTAWKRSIDSFILYGDPSLQIKLTRSQVTA